MHKWLFFPLPFIISARFCLCCLWRQTQPADFPVPTKQDLSEKIDTLKLLIAVDSERPWLSVRVVWCKLGITVESSTYVCKALMWHLKVLKVLERHEKSFPQMVQTTFMQKKNLYISFYVTNDHENMKGNLNVCVYVCVFPFGVWIGLWVRTLTSLSCQCLTERISWQQVVYLQLCECVWGMRPTPDPR